MIQYLNNIFNNYFKNLENYYFLRSIQKNKMNFIIDDIYITNYKVLLKFFTNKNFLM